MKIVADPNIPFVTEAFGGLGEVVTVPGRQLAATDIRDAEMLLVRSVTTVDRQLLEASPVRFVATATIGTDHIDRAYLAAHGIGFASAAGSNANSVAEYVVAALLVLGQRYRFRLRDRTLGVVGVGNVGRRVVRYAEALGMRVLVNDPPRQRAEGGRHWLSLEHLLAEADIVSLHVPLTHNGPDATYHLLATDQLDGFQLVNTARGAVVDNPALLAASRAGRVPAAVLDVWEHEPRINRELLERVDIATPHIAGYSFDGKVNGTQLIYRAACEHLGIEPTWEPRLPAPPVPRVETTAGDREDDEDLLQRIVGALYDITADDARLRADPAGFDRLRAEYPVRREFGHTAVAVAGAGDALCRKLQSIGCRLELS